MITTKTSRWCWIYSSFAEHFENEDCILGSSISRMNPNWFSGISGIIFRLTGWRTIFSRIWECGPSSLWFCDLSSLVYRGFLATQRKLISTCLLEISSFVDLIHCLPDQVYAVVLKSGEHLNNNLVRSCRLTSFHILQGPSYFMFQDSGTCLCRMEYYVSSPSW